MEPEKAQPFIDGLAPQTPYEQAVISTEWRNSKVTYLVCEEDESVLPEKQREIAREYDMQIATIDTGHCPFVSQPEKFVQVIDEILKS